MLDIERALLCSVINAEEFSQSEESKKIQAIDLNENDFTSFFHKAVVKVINAMKAKKVGITAHLVEHYLTKNNLLSHHEWMLILEQVGFGAYGTVESYLKTLKGAKKDSLAMEI